MSGKRNNPSAQDLVARIRLLESQIGQISHREQEKLGHALHDVVGQELTGISFMLKALENDITESSPALRDRIELMEKMISQCQEHCQALAQAMSPVHLGQRGLGHALTKFAADSMSIYRVPIENEIANDIDLPDDEAETEFFRIAQEAVGNAVKHAHAQNIHLRLFSQDGATVLEVEDDGIGTSLRGGTDKGMGLQIMGYRAKVLGASLNVTRSVTGGTLVQCKLSQRI